MAGMKTISLIAAEQNKQREQLQSVMDHVVATLAAARVAIELLDSKVAFINKELEQAKKQGTPSSNG